MQEQTLSIKEVYAGRLLRLEIHEVALPGGRAGRREIVRHPGAAAVVAETVDGCFVFVRQYRKAVESELLELPAGCLETGETTEACAIREVREETGREVRRLRRLGSVFSSPGFCDETVDLFHALLEAGAAPPCPDADETVAPMALTRAEVGAALTEGRIRDAKTVAGWCLFERLQPDR